jgi:hypothetical protein
MAGLATGSAVRGGPRAASAPAVLAHAHAALRDARRAQTAGDRFCAAHLAALRAAAAVVAERGRPGGRRRLVSVWVLLDSVAPELREWSSYFASTAALRGAVEAGAYSAVSSRAAEDELRAAEQFVAMAASACGLLPAALAS